MDTTTTTNHHRIASFGEVLWDCLPGGLFLGGAPLNAAFHCRRLGAEAAIVSAVGDDFLGGEALRRIRVAEIGADAVAVDPRRPTGTVLAELDGAGNASYRFPDDVAWDAIPASDAARRVVASSDALIFGSLAMRSPANRAAFDELVAGFGGVLVMDINLRPPFRERAAILDLARRAGLVKLNHDELAWFTGGGADHGPDALCRRTEDFAGLLGTGATVCVTLGSGGAGLLEGNEWAAAAAPRISVRDTVGAGDAFTAAMTLAFLAGDLPSRLARCAAIGAFVASKSGAMPAYEPDDLEAFLAQHLPAPPGGDR